MNEAEVIETAQEALWLSIKLGAPVLLVGLFVGVAIALLQALTQIQEMTLVFVPKIFAIMMALFLTLPFMMRALVSFMEALADKMIALG
ncbi:MAG: flagellar biosynthetic protein FliQ [Micavibrio sp.]|nr:flagellar biosynthetic protein FliQ [Micavibrio sp.]|tara:strand:- start:3930 stop:4196 length:267 start_codon:yes stop_codon:yes gene_type:complete